MKAEYQHQLDYNIPLPNAEERPAIYASRIGEIFYSNSPCESRKKNGQYYTPLEIADLMSSQIVQSKKTIRILDAGAGSGILGCALCEHLACQKEKPLKIELIAFENNEKAVVLLKKSFEYLKSYLNKINILVDFQIHTEDFVLHNAHNLQTESFFNQFENESKYDICISNPPYFKLAKTDSRSKAASAVVHGQPNIYFLFMAIAASVLNPNGEFVFIVPRSFASGSYFRLFREKFFSLVRPEFIHLFDSRKDAFKKDGILQENIVLKAVREENWQAGINDKSITISSSRGVADIESSKTTQMSLVSILDIRSKNKVLKIPQENWERISTLFKEWKGTLNEYGLKISTGPVVAFRATKFISEEKTEDKKYAPLLWLHNVKAMEITWPAYKSGKAQYIEESPESMPLLIPNGNYVLIRRFSAKEEARRLVASPFIGRLYPFDFIGLENHLNYIYRPNGILTEDETFGLAALYNSSIYDQYFRGINGSTQVGATEINSLSFPSLETIIEIGKKAMSGVNSSEKIDLLLNMAFDETICEERIPVNV